MVGNNVSHSNNRTKRRFDLNIQNKKFYLPTEKKWITLKVSTAGLRTINRIGITEAMKRARANGYIK